ncbi:MAG: hypothetical protein WAV27_15125 [Xanthobacteraceae bacterium]|jgi:hypothetical protein
MPEHPYTSRCILIAAMALFGIATAQAASKDRPATDTGVKDASPAIRLDQLGGTWKNANSGVNVRIEQAAVGWEVWFSTSGEARITLPEKNRPTIKIDGRNFTCTYSVTLPSAQTMKWDLTQGQPETQCLTGTFTRLGPAPSEVKHTAPAAPAQEVRQAVKPAAERPVEVKKPEPVVEPSPASGRAPILAPARSMQRHAALYRKPLTRITTRHRGWRVAAPQWQYASNSYRPYRYYRYRYRWYVVFFSRCGCR